MISENRLRTLARNKKAGVGLMEKDYVNSWILYAIFQSSFADKLLFKGGTALSKLYFPQRWRFSEDLDFTVISKIENLMPNLEESLSDTSDLSGIGFRIRDTHENPDYMQIKIQYDAILAQKNTTKLDLFWDELVHFSSVENTYTFEDVPEFDIKYYSL
ncbi:nucleotidyl transferase AbiEii/AbiGii toxin family protein [Candidatus Bipolaricaulota bacterium]|nr:nucleotidyl transferase AbiEii/AbiGii toxin family protein [Candidatus Bipolaricaulota bacterium]